MLTLTKILGVEMDAILAPQSVSIYELKANPIAVLDGAEGLPVAVLSHNRPVAYIVPAAAWALICEALEDIELHEVMQRRLTDGKAPVEVGLNDL